MTDDEQVDGIARDQFAHRLQAVLTIPVASVIDHRRSAGARDDSAETWSDVNDADVDIIGLHIEGSHCCTRGCYRTGPQAARRKDERKEDDRQKARKKTHVVTSLAPSESMTEPPRPFDCVQSVPPCFSALSYGMATTTSLDGAPSPAAFMPRTRT